MEVCFHHLIAEHIDPVPIEVLDDAEAYKSLCEKNMTEFIRQIYNNIERENTEDGVLGVLAQPHEAKIKLPRRLPLPQKKPMTRWEKFAKEKGIQKSKHRNRLAFDDADQNWKLRWGGRSIKKAQEKREWLIEHKPGQDPMADPFEARSLDKAERKAKQNLQEIRNKVEAKGYRLPSKASTFSSKESSAKRVQKIKSTRKGKKRGQSRAS